METSHAGVRSSQNNKQITKIISREEEITHRATINVLDVIKTKYPNKFF